MTYYGNKDLGRSFRTVRRNTLTIAEEIPEDKYGYRPAEGCRSVAETLAPKASWSNGHTAAAASGTSAGT